MLHVRLFSSVELSLVILTYVEVLGTSNETDKCGTLLKIPGKDMFDEEITIHASLPILDGSGSVVASLRGLSDKGSVASNSAEKNMKLISSYQAGDGITRKRSDSIISKTGKRYQIDQTMKEKNYNMISAAVHLSADFFNALVELIAAISAMYFGINADIADASASLISAVCILLLSLHVLYDISLYSERLIKTKSEVIEDSLFFLLTMDLE